MGVASDGSVWSWGWNFNGQLGDGTRIDHATPARVIGIKNAIAVAATYFGGGAYALAPDGTMLAWGNNDNGEVGDGTLVPRLTPVSVIDESLVGLFDLLPNVPNDGSYGKPPAFFSETTSTSALTDPPLTVNGVTKFNPAH